MIFNIIFSQGEEEILEIEKIKIVLTTLQKEKNNANYNNNVTSIFLGSCETLLRDAYNISNNESIYIKKVDIKQENMKIPKIVYDLFYKINSTNLVEMNKSICRDNKISLIVPVELTESLDKLNSSGDYYNNVCYTTDSDNGLDIPLKDRRK